MASGAEKRRGVLIAFRNSMLFTCTRSLKDAAGRYLVLVGKLQDLEVTVVSYYAPNEKQGPLFSHLLQVVDTYERGALILCGDSTTNT